MLESTTGNHIPSRAIPITSGLIGYWSGDGNANDLSGNGNNGTLINGTTFVTGKVGQAFSLDGVDDLVEIPDNDLWAFGTDDFTIDLWVNFQSSDFGIPDLPRAVFLATDEGSGPQDKWVGSAIHIMLFRDCNGK
jgi:hypothetical protein